jgi:hypothetical protein
LSFKRGEENEDVKENMYLLWKTGRCNEAMFFQSQGPIQMRLMGEFVPVKQNFVLKTGMAELRLCGKHKKVIML